MKLLSILFLLFSPLQPDLRIADLERRLHEEINAERRKQDRGPLIFDDRLADVARAHSADMAKQGFFNHVNPDGRNPQQRARAAGYKCSRQIGENIFQNNLYSRIRKVGGKTIYDWNTIEDIAETSVEGWMKSPAHRSNLLEKTYDRTGIGVAIAANGKVYITQMFCR
jgi:uncharacterized protein YkwD